MVFFNETEFLENATGWGVTPIKILPEQAVVLQRLVGRIEDNRPPGVDDVVHEYMKVVYGHRFHLRQDRNSYTYEMRLNRTPYNNLSADAQMRRDKAMISMASTRELLLLQDEQQLGSLEIGRNTHPYRQNDLERAVVLSDITEACLELDDASEIPATNLKWKIRGSDIISLQDGRDTKGMQPRALFVTSKQECVYMPKHDTMVNERRSYILDLEQFAEYEPRVVALLRQYDVHELGREKWTNKMTELWRDISYKVPLITSETQGCLYDLSTTFYTVNQRRLASIANRESLIARRRIHSLESPELKTYLQEARRAYQELGSAALSSQIEW